MRINVVDGVAVLAAEPAETPLSKPGKPVLFKTINKLLLADGRTVFACAICGHIDDDSASKIRGHQVAAHQIGVRGSKRPTKQPTAPVNDMTVGELVAQVSNLKFLQAQVDNLLADRDAWKARALKAEKALSTMRRALGVDG